MELINLVSNKRCFALVEAMKQIQSDMKNRSVYEQASDKKELRQLASQIIEELKEMQSPKCKVDKMNLRLPKQKLINRMSKRM